MEYQLCLFENVGDTKTMSPTEIVGDNKMQAIKRYLKQGKKDPTVCIEKYSPNHRKTEYFRLKYRLGEIVKTIHIPGGSTIANLANHRAKTLQKMIDRGAELDEILATIKDYCSGAK